MFELYPPDDPFLLTWPFEIRWYGVLIMSGALLAGWLSARRAARRGYNPDDVWNLLMIGLIFGILGARAYYVIFQWREFAGRPFWDIINMRNGGLAIHGALIGAVTAAFIYTRYKALPFIKWLDLCMPGFLLAQAVGRWGNFFNQEAYGRPTDLGFGVRIDADKRVDPYADMGAYPPETLFHPTFLYESLWNLAGVGLLLWLERRLRGWLRAGDIALFYAVIYGSGRFWIEGLRTDSLCTSGTGGACEGALRVAQLISLALVAGGGLGLIINHLRPVAPAPSEAETVVEQPAEQQPATGETASAALANES